MTAHTRSPVWRSTGVALALGVAYAALSQCIATLSAFGTSSGATFWPGAGLTLGVLLARPRREWPLLLGAVFAAEALMDVKLGYGVGLGLQWAVANTVEPLVGATLLTWAGRAAPDTGRRDDLWRFLLCGVVAGPAVGALLGTAGGVLIAGDPWWPRLPRWFVGDGVGVLAVAPAVYLLLSGGARRVPWRGAAGGALLVAVTAVAVGPWAFTGRIGLPFLVVPALVAFVVRTGAAGAAGGVLTVSLVVLSVTAADRGPFAQQGPFEGIVVAQMFVVMTALTGLTVAALLRDVISRAEAERTLREAALRDNLTGLANRRLLFDRLGLASARLERHAGLAALLFVDLDRFKEVNDTLGHVSGDAVLVETGRRLSEVVRDGDTVARLGGDEFLVLAEDLDSDADAQHLADRIVGALAAPIACPGGVAHVGASVGLVTVEHPFDDPGDLLMRADQAMYRAKQAGGGRMLRAAV